MKTRTKIGLAATTLSLYLGLCVQNSIKVSQALRETGYAERFTAVAETSGSTSQFDPNTSRNYLDYGGRLDEILEQRDKFLRSNNSFRLGSWRVNQYYSSNNGQDSLNFQISTPTRAFCYNPFRKIN